MISNSKIQCFKSCRRLYELKYLKGIEPAQKAEALEIGLSYHDGIEKLIQGELEPSEVEDIKVRAMLKAFEKYILPDISHFGIKCEEWFRAFTPAGHVICGRYDGVAEDGSFVIEHKTTSSAVDGSYMAGLENDEQIPMYMWASGARKIYYTVCQKPTIRQKKNETDEEFEQRCIDWYDEETEKKIAMFPIIRTEEEIEDFEDSLTRICEEIENCKLFYKVPSHCKKWGRLCEYSSICNLKDSELNSETLAEFQVKKG